MKSPVPVGILCILGMVIILTGCTTGPEVEVPGKPIDAVEATHDGWRPMNTWTLAEMSPGVWFTLNTALCGNGPFKQQFVNATTADGHPISFRCDGGAARLKAVPEMTPDGKVARATLIMYTKTDRDNEYTRYELDYPLKGM